MKQKRTPPGTRIPTSVRLSQPTRAKLDWIANNVLLHATMAYAIAWCVEAAYAVHQKKEAK